MYREFTGKIKISNFPLHLPLLSVIILDGTKYTRRGLAALVPFKVGEA
jgi:hypothetical protein